MNVLVLPLLPTPSNTPPNRLRKKVDPETTPPANVEVLTMVPLQQTRQPWEPHHRTQNE
eukprot:CAMPEP_0202871668 /NCGR_PEP_ID=MMETSP1391-20130828/19375_1 /ASSEMBLY_ACC=CAM_ASM_000867 /TAXON_ID=1034604 /ORGANISM="Chlamydomonas leiostraca, Strain SAG 11-49" /LENGTH=58 /DNA_ID=CAMNT_0049552547 /DNA_START=799 /DNA_END=975 /DNA_ORIENTATION=+